MKKSNQTKNILKEWRKFEFKHKKLNESQNTPAPPKRVKHKPSQKAIDLKKELEGKFGKDSFYCYDNFDGHSDEEMLDPGDGGYQIEIEALVKHIKNISGFPNDIGVSDIVMTEDDIIFREDNDKFDEFKVTEIGSFDMTWSNYGPTKYFHGEIDINGRIQKIIYKHGRGYTVYYLFPDSDGSQQEPRKKFKLRLGGAWN